MLQVIFKGDGVPQVVGCYLVMCLMRQLSVASASEIALARKKNNGRFVFVSDNAKSTNPI